MTLRHAVVLLSGGLDSATVLALALQEGFACHGLTVRYGQRHSHEVECAGRVARSFGVEHRILDLDLSAFGGSSLLAGGAAVPKEERAPVAEYIPSTYVPARNTILLALGLAWCEALDGEAVFVGVNAVDYSGYPDCRPEYLEAFQRLADLATRRGVEGRPIHVRAPLLHWTKARIIGEGLRLGVPYASTSSCYDPDPGGSPCGRCDSCRLRARGFEEVGVPDPLTAR
jgi:7-cyano-7-deazaguanine synthase